MFKSLFIAALAIISASALAQPVQQFFVNNDGEYLVVESRDNNTAFPAVVAAIKKAGYRLNTSDGIKPGTKTDTWCKVDVYQARQILGECYTPYRPGIAREVLVRDRLTWSQHSFQGDYSGVAPMIAKIRDEHRRASAVLGIK